LGQSNGQLFSRSLALFRSEVRVAFAHAQTAVPDFQLDDFPWHPSALYRRYSTMAECMHRADRDSNLSANRTEHVAIHVAVFSGVLLRAATETG